MPFRILLTAAVLALCTAAAESHDPAEVRKAAASVTKDLGVQSRLPNSSGTAESAQGGSSGLGLGGHAISIPAPAAVFTLLQWVMIAIAVVALLALLAVVVREQFEPGARRSVSGAPPEPDTPLAPTDPRALLARADELAAAGRFAEAMHCVLLAAMATIGGGQTLQSADSLTSWELLRSSPLPPPQLQTARELVIRVERTWFGKRPAAVEDYRYVRGKFDQFASPARDTA